MAKKTTINYKLDQVKQKQELAKQLSPSEEMTREICEQIEICEFLCRPITEMQIREWVKLTIYGMLNKVHSHKFA